MKKIQSIILFSIILTLISLSTSITAFAENSIPVPEINPNVITRGSPAFPFTLEDVLTDTTFSFSSLTGKVVVLDFFSVACLACIYSIPELIAAKAKYSAADFEIVSVDIEPTETEPEIETFAANYEIDWKVVRGPTDLVNYYELLDLPTFYVIDQEQVIYQAIFGEENFDELDRFVLELLPEYSPSSNPTNGGGGPIPEFWSKNWYWFVLGGVMFIVVIGLFVQRRRIVLHNRKIRSQKTEARQKRLRKKER